MENLKEFFINEVNQAVKKELVKKNLKESSKDLYEAVNLETKLKKEAADHKKLQLASDAVKLAEIKVLEDYDELDGGCDCEEGEGKMLKAQLLSIMNHAEKLFHMIDENDHFEDWIQSKITIAEDYMRASYSYLTYYNGDGEADEADWDEEEWGDDDWDDVYEEDDFDGQPAMPMAQYHSALDPTVDDDEIFEQKRSK